jgi:hypothetical protein
MWREPYLVYKYVFNKSIRHYWKTLASFFLIIVIIGGGMKFIFYKIALPVNIWAWVFEGIIITAVFNGILIILFKNHPDLQFFKNKITGIIAKVKKSSN